MNKRMWAMGLAAGLFVASVALADPPSEGLVLHYSFDPDAGWVAPDLSGNGNDGQVVGAEVVPGVTGSGVQLDGRSAFIRTPSSASLMPEAITLATWVRLDGLPDSVKGLIFKRNQGYNDNESYALEVTPSGAARLVLGNGGWQRVLDSRTLLEPGRWHHVAATFSRPDMKVYVDGVLSATAVYDLPLQHNPATDLFVGARDHLAHSMDSFAAVSLDEVRIYAGALSAEEIAKLAGVQPAPGGLVLHYTFDQDEGGIVTDASGHGRTAKVNGATWVADGARGGAIRFDNNRQTISATDAGLPSGDASRSIALWMKTDREYSDGCTGMLGYGTQGYDYRFTGIGFDWRLDRDRVYFSPGGACFLTAQKLPAQGTWMHVAYTYGGSGDHRLYFNGVPSDGMSELWGPVNTTLSGLLLLGGHPDNPGPDGGYLDDVRIYDRVLSVGEITALASPSSSAAGAGDEEKIEIGADPRDSETEVPVVLGVDPAKDRPGGVTLRWGSQPGKAYTILWSTNLAQGFDVLVTDWVATETESLFLPSARDAPAGYFAVQEQ